MSNLVFIKGKEVVTDSRTVAKVFGKSHDKVLRDVRELECSEEFSLANFGESTYTKSDKIPRKDFEEAIQFIQGWFPREKKQFQEV